jgi:hypothetical protein
MFIILFLEKELKLKQCSLCQRWNGYCDQTNAPLEGFQIAKESLLSEKDFYLE